MIPLNTKIPSFKIINGNKNEMIKKMKKLKENGDLRRKEKKLFMEGPSLIFDLIKNGIKPHQILFTQKYLKKSLQGGEENELTHSINNNQHKRQLKSQEGNSSSYSEFEFELEEMRRKLGLNEREIIGISEEVMKTLSDTSSPQGIVAIFPFPSSFQGHSKEKEEESTSNHSTLKGKKWILVLNEVQEPGNLGSLLRSACALGWEGAFIMKGSCDPVNPKALRASSGALFHLPIQMGSWEDFRKLSKEENWKCVVADSKGISVENLEKERKESEGEKRGIALILSNESEGMERNLDQFPEERIAVSVPMINHQIESLNVTAAGAILMQQLRKVHK
eukprot:TRINITY_DN5450_c0_g1_i1.p1 TRINITY_DN5450_c0_g1~~TRINITY_DN5450_c0_g1_i1.p1  ORF type:complete len:335 (-),score=156.60 TRINITY_DN5450_c0_g1_i1:222-1226(-)